MAEHEDPRVSAHYRSLGDAQPPEALDAAILAASRRAVGAGPRRSPVRRWALPVSIAAVLVLTMSVVVRIEVERPGLERATQVPATPQVLEKKAMQLESEPAAQAKAKVSAAPEKLAVPARQFVPEPPAARAPASAAQSNLGAVSAPAPASVAPALAAPAPSEAKGAGKKVESPRAWLERIVRLRREGHVKEADRSLAEFRERYPDYVIPKDLRAAVLGGKGRQSTQSGQLP